MFALLCKPAALFAALKEKPGHRWWLPLAIVTALAVLSGVMMSGRVDFASAIEESITESGKSIPPEAMDRAVEMGGKFTRVMMIAGGLLFPVIVYCVFSAWCWLAANVQKKPATFLHLLGLYAWTDMVNVPRYLLGMVNILRAGEISSFKTLKAMGLLTPLSFMGDVSGMNLHLVSLLETFNLFTLTHLALLAAGLAAIAGLSRARALAVALLPWAVSVAWAALQFALHRGGRP